MILEALFEKFHNYFPNGSVNTGKTPSVFPDCNAISWDKREKVDLDSRSESSI